MLQNLGVQATYIKAREHIYFTPRSLVRNKREKYMERQRKRQVEKKFCHFNIF
jgi:hypothetical protein